MSCFAGDDNDSHCPLIEIHRQHSLHSYMVHMHAVQLASAQLLQQRGHFELMNYLVVSCARGRMCLISKKEGGWRACDSLFLSLFFFFCEGVRKRELSSVVSEGGVCAWYLGAEEPEQQDSVRSNRLPLRIRKRTWQGDRKNMSREGIKQSKKTALCSISS